jgi:hypothetical protein
VAATSQKDRIIPRGEVHRHGYSFDTVPSTCESRLRPGRFRLPETINMSERCIEAEACVAAFNAAAQDWNLETEKLKLAVSEADVWPASVRPSES